MSTVVAHQPVGTAVQAHGHMAVRAFGDGAAFRALDGRRIGASGAEYEYLLAGFQRLLDFLQKLPGKTPRHPAFPPFRDRVDDADFRLFAGVEPFL